MQSITKRLLTAELTTTASDTSYTAGDNTNTQFRACTLTNKSGSNRWVSVRVTPSGGTARYLVYQQVVPAGLFFTPGAVIAQALNPGDKIDFAAEAATTFDLSLTGTESTTS